jgi:hypothetical protein
MKLSIRLLRWFFLALYLAVVAILLVRLFGRLSGSPSTHDSLWALVTVGIFFATQIIFIFGAGTIELCRPIKKRRLLIPVIVASSMAAILVGGIVLALAELFREHNSTWFPYFFWVILAVSWAGWAFVFYVHCQRLDRYTTLKRITLWVLGGSLVELLVTVPSHIIVSRRPGCFVGMYTMCGIIAGLCVMLWAFGPGIALLFLRDRRALPKQTGVRGT